MSTVCENPARRAGEVRGFADWQPATDELRKLAIDDHAPAPAGIEWDKWLIGWGVVGGIGAIVVLALLPALYGPACCMPDNTVRKAEVMQLSQAFEQFKARYGSYPPDFSDSNRVNLVFRKMFPRSLESPPQNLDRAQALVFWLGGFSPDPEHPITGAGERAPFFQFAPERIQESGAYPVYLPKASTAPYVYFESQTYDRSTNNYTSLGTGTARPYREDSGFWCNRKSFQIITAGQDNDYGNHATANSEGRWPSGTNYTASDRDNIVNFNERATLGDDLP